MYYTLKTKHFRLHSTTQTGKMSRDLHELGFETIFFLLQKCVRYALTKLSTKHNKLHHKIRQYIYNKKLPVASLIPHMTHISPKFKMIQIRNNKIALIKKTNCNKRQIYTSLLKEVRHSTLLHWTYHSSVSYIREGKYRPATPPAPA